MMATDYALGMQAGHADYVSGEPMSPQIYREKLERSFRRAAEFHGAQDLDEFARGYREGRDDAVMDDEEA